MLTIFRTAFAAFTSSRPLQLLAVVLAVGALSLAVERCANKVMSGAVDRGKQQERITNIDETLKRVEKANEIREEVRDPSSRARYDECLQSARNPENCKRFLPQ